MRFLFVVGVVAMMATMAIAAHWNTRASGSTKGTEMCEREEKGGAWTDRDAPTRCGTCESRCYFTTFNATVIANGPPSGLCNVTGDNCNIQIYLASRPCCACSGGTQISTTTQFSLNEENELEEIEIISTDSRCEIDYMLVLVNGVWTLPYEPSCDLDVTPRFTQTVVKDDTTTNTIRDCPAINNAGSRLAQVYNTGYHNGNYPDPCFSAKHWRETFVSQELGSVESSFKMWHPTTNAVWFDVTLTDGQQPHFINCKDLPDVAAPLL